MEIFANNICMDVNFVLKINGFLSLFKIQLISRVVMWDFFNYKKLCTITTEVTRISFDKRSITRDETFSGFINLFSGF